MELTQTDRGDSARRYEIEQTTILVVEPDEMFRDTLTYHLRGEGYFVMLAADGAAAIEMARHNSLALIVLAMEPPNTEGMRLCRQLRSDPDTTRVPIIAMTASGSEVERIATLEAGADDYVAKPFNWIELRARLRAILRRSLGRDATATAEVEPRLAEQRVLDADGLHVDVDRRLVLLNGDPVDLKRRLFDLLVYMMRYRGIVLTRDRLLQHVWGYTFGGDMRTVDVHIRWLRERIEANPANPRLIQTIHGVGYRFRDG